MKSQHLLGNEPINSALLLHSKVNNGCLGRDLRGVLRVAQLGCNVELEVWVKFHLLISKFDDQAVTCMKQERASISTLDNSFQTKCEEERVFQFNIWLNSKTENKNQVIK